MTPDRSSARSKFRSAANCDHLSLQLDCLISATVPHCQTVDLIDAALKAVPPLPTPTAPDRRRQFGVIEGGKA